MGAPDRRVRQLRLRARDAADVRRTARVLEDALRCASLPDDGGRLLLVRRLRLGHIAAEVSPQSLSLQLERCIAVVGAAWVRGIDAHAEHADFVVFRDRLEARCDLARRLVQGAPCRAWFWPLAVPEFKSSATLQDNLCSIALAIAALPEAPVALPMWISQLIEAGGAQVLAHSIGPIEAMRLLYSTRLQAHGQPASLPPWPGLPQRIDQDVDAPEVSAREAIAADFGTVPARLRGLAGATCRVATASIESRVVPPLTTPRAAPGTAMFEPSAAGNTHGVQPAIDLHAVNARQVPPQAPELGTPRDLTLAARDSVQPHRAPRPQPTNPGDTDFSPTSQRRAVARDLAEPISKDRGLPDAQSSMCAGLLFLLPVLKKLGFDAWAESLAAGAAMRVVATLFDLVLRGVQASSADPARLMVDSVTIPELANVAGDPPPRWRDAALAAPRAGAANDIFALAAHVQPAESFAHLWLIACRRWLRRVAGFGVAGLVLRPGALRLTPTHADIFLPLSSADIRVRRVGLDIDPGWLPWFGRVVAFHYTAQLSSLASSRSHGAPHGG